MYQSDISSNLLFHYTKNPEIVISILEKGFYPRVALEDASFILPNYDKQTIGIPMVCFTDIPYNLATEHRSEYGSFGIGLKKEWGIKNGICPIAYFVRGTKANATYNKLQKLLIDYALKLDDGVHRKKKQKQKHTEHRDEALNILIEYAGFLKIYSEDVYTNIKPYYNEREWRYLPPFIDEKTEKTGYCNRLLTNDCTEKNKLNKYMEEHYTLNFTLIDLEMLIVPEEAKDNLKRLIQQSSLERKSEYIDKIVGYVD